VSTQQRLNYDEAAGVGRVVSPFLELGAYEALWMREGMTVKRMADLFRERPEALPSDLVPEGEAREMAERVVGVLREKGVERFGVRVHRAGEYPAKLREARHPVEVLTFQGWWSFVEQRSVAVVGTRKASEEGRRRAAKLARALVGDGFAVVSGLAAGIDRVVHESALEAGGVTIAVIGTPLSETYPRENRELQRRIAGEHLVISQVPVARYLAQDWRANRSWFPERNVTMSALTEATVIVEAGETSGTLIQARAALDQGRKLFVLESCFQAGLAWPARLEERGAVRVASYEEIRERLGAGSAE
jgi:DNA processing protein